ncbi:MAG: chorismate mutase [Clostridiales Family XIII bacterium]|jgi:chorismate mutase/prephenate dehydratase|nr:chorismate mutase [Clostridiales Family XIII bacterium]
MDAELKQYRDNIDEVDREIVRLFERRMHLAKEVGDYKREHNMSILDSTREQAIAERAADAVSGGLKGEVTLLMRALMALAREYQRSSQFGKEEPFLPPPATPKREGVHCVYQGAPGAWSEQAARKLFPGAELSAAAFFEDVFEAVKKERADYGVVAIENSQSGAIGETYDLLRKYGCYVVGRTWIDIKHCLIAKPGAALTGIREVYSHPEGFRQCHRFLMDKAWDLIACSNTAVAVEKVRASGGDKAAAIGSRLAAELNGLAALAPDIMDAANNKTSFVVIGREPEYTERSDLISVTFSVAHRSGSLCEALLPFMAAGLNLTRIESRPVSPGNYRFFAEISGNILDRGIVDTLRHVAGATEYLEVLGCYHTV